MPSKNTPKRGRPPGPTEKGRATRARLYSIATTQLAKNGFEGTTMRAIAAQADVSPALLYRYFPSKLSVVVALHSELSGEYAEEASAMKSGKWAKRFIVALEQSLATLQGERRTLLALIPSLVGPRDEGLFAPATADSRRQVQAVFEECVLGAKDAPKPADAAALGRVLYFAHLGVIMWWLLDRSPGQRATRGLVALLAKALAPFALALRLPSIRRLVAGADGLINDALFASTSPN